MSSSALLTDEALLKEANEVAGEAIQEWCRATLREVALQAIQQIVLRKQEICDDNDHPVGEEISPEKRVLELTERDIDSVQFFCRKVADRWASKLDLQGHEQAAEWIRQLAQRESTTTLFQKTEIVESEFSRTPVVSVPDSSSDAEIDEDNYLLPATFLSDLGRKNPKTDDNGSYTRHLIDKIDRAGCLGHTNWPYPWKSVQQYSDSIPERLYREENQARTRGRVIPHITDTPSEKNGSGPASLITVAREPSDVHCFRWEKTDPLISDIDKQKLQQLIHPTKDEASEEVEENYLLGGLCNLGHPHYSRQHVVDGLNTELLSHSRHLRSQRRYRKERLGDRKELSEEFRRRKRISRVHMTKSETPTEEYGVDFDVANCMIDFCDANTKRRKMLAFRSLEAILTDMEKSPGET